MATFKFGDRVVIARTRGGLHDNSSNRYFHGGTTKDVAIGSAGSIINIERDRAVVRLEDGRSWTLDLNEISPVSVTARGFTSESSAPLSAKSLPAFPEPLICKLMRAEPFVVLEDRLFTVGANIETLQGVLEKSYLRIANRNYELVPQDMLAVIEHLDGEHNLPEIRTSLAKLSAQTTTFDFARVNEELLDVKMLSFIVNEVYPYVARGDNAKVKIDKESLPNMTDVPTRADFERALKAFNPAPRDSSVFQDVMGSDVLVIRGRVYGLEVDARENEDVAARTFVHHKGEKYGHVMLGPVGRLANMYAEKLQGDALLLARKSGAVNAITLLHEQRARLDERIQKLEFERHEFGFTKLGAGNYSVYISIPKAYCLRTAQGLYKFDPVSIEIKLSCHGSNEEIVYSAHHTIPNDYVHPFVRDSVGNMCLGGATFDGKLPCGQAVAARLNMCKQVLLTGYGKEHDAQWNTYIGWLARRTAVSENQAKSQGLIVTNDAVWRQG